jgi:hypothetical protein
MKRKLIFITLLFFVLAFNASSSVSLILPNKSGANGTQVTVPVKVKDFLNIISAQGTIQFDQTILSYVSIQQYGLPGMNSGNFGISQVGSGKITFSWFDGTLAGVTLADSTTIFSITFNIIGTNGQVSPLNFISVPTTLEIINNTFTPETVMSVNGSVTVQSIVVPAQVTLYLDTITSATGTQVSISLRSMDFKNINSVQGTIQFNTTVATYAGISFYGLPGMNIGNFGTSQVGSGKLMFSWNDPTLNGVNMANTAPLFTILFNLPGAPGTQTMLDLVNTPTPIEVVDSLFNPLTTSLTSGRIRISSLPVSNSLQIYCDSVNAPYGSLVNVSMRAIDFTNIIAAQGTLQFNTAIATFDTLIFYGLPNMSSSNFGLTQTGSGKLMYSWNDPTLAGVTIADSAILFTMKFNVVGTPGTNTPVAFINTPTTQEYVDNAFNVLTPTLKSGKICVINNGTLSLSDPSSLVFCQGDIFTINYSVTGTFLPGNLFILQVSDLFGSFSSPVNMDTIVGTTSGTFTVHIPLAAAPGTGYHFRMISTNPVLQSPPNPTAITVLGIPTKPPTPIGATTLCKDPSNTIYTSGATYATAYVWSIYPASAGVISGTSNAATVDWNASFTGTAFIKVRGTNGSCTGQFSDSLSVLILEYPGTPVKPSGDSVLCQNPGSIGYSVPVVLNATSYNWQLNPVTAGTIVGTGNNITINWNPAFSGNATLSVNGINIICSGSTSANLNIQVNAHPAIPVFTAGDTSLCVNPPNSTYTIGSVPGATSYTWIFAPPAAGIITPAGTSAIVDWNNSYTGAATIFVSASTGSCIGLNSDTLIINIHSIPGQAATPTGSNVFCTGVASGIYSTTGAVGASSFGWGLYPAAAGSVSGTGNSGTVTWTPGWSGTVWLFVRGINSCGNGIYSDSLLITINTVPGQAATPTGNSEFCVGNPSGVYSTTGATDASSFGWGLFPPAAGSVAGTTNSATVTWNPGWSGTAWLFVRGINSCGNGINSDSLLITIDPLPGQAATPTGTTAYCMGDPSGTYSTTGALNATSYQWVLHPIAAGTVSGSGNSTSISWTPGWSGSAWIYVRGINSCGNGTYSDSLMIMVNTIPSQAATPTGISSYCLGDPSGIYTTTGANGATSYQWVLHPIAAGTVPGTGNSTTVNWTPGWTGTAWIYVRGINGCGSGTYSDSLLITIHPLPTQPVISQNGGTLSSSYPTGNQWYYNGSTLSGETNQDYIPIINGDYYVIYTDGNGCWSSSDTLNVNSVSVQEYNNHFILDIFPNPNNGKFTINFSVPSSGEISLEIINGLGSAIFRMDNVDINKFGQLHLDISGESSGIYFMIITSGDEVFRTKFILDNGN